MSKPPFVMSKYASLEDLLKDKCAWQEQQITELQRELKIQDDANEILTRENAELKHKLSWWETPHDAELFAKIEQQASHKDSLAANTIYIGHCERRIKELERIIAESKEQKPVAWSYEWFGIYDTADFESWNLDISTEPVDADEGVRNITPLYASPSIQDGMVAVPVEPTEKMIQAACLSQSTKKYNTYEEWWNDTSSGISERIHNYIINDYKAMIEAYNEK